MENKPQTHLFSAPDVDPEFNASFCERLGKAINKATRKDLDRAPNLVFLSQMPHAPKPPQMIPNESAKACNEPKSIPNKDDHNI